MKVGKLLTIAVALAMVAGALALALAPGSQAGSAGHGADDESDAGRAEACQEPDSCEGPGTIISASAAI